MQNPLEGRVRSLEHLFDDAAEFTAFLVLRAWAGTQGTVSRSFRLWTSVLGVGAPISTSQDHDESTEPSRLTMPAAAISKLKDEWLEEIRNLAQITLLTQGDMHHWTRKLARDWIGVIAGGESGRT